MVHDCRTIRLVIKVILGTIIISTATVLVCFAYVQRIAVGMYLSLRVIDPETAVGYEGTAAATARYSLCACNH